MSKPLLITLLPLLGACFSSSDDAPTTPASGAAAPAATDAPTGGAPPITGLHLQSLVASSGDGVEAVLDGRPATGWSPEGDPMDEGILLRFEEPTRVLQANIQLCADSAAATFQTYINGNENTRVRVNPGGPVLIPWREQLDSPALKSLYVRVLFPDGPVEICEIGLALPPEIGKQVRPPRTVPATIAASSVLEPADAYHPAYLYDGRTDFGWVEGVDGLGQGESVTITFEAPTTITGFDLWNGYQRSEDHFRKNARASALSLSVDGAESIPLTVSDTQGPQFLALPAPVTGERFELSITGTIEGSKYADLVLSELRPHDELGPLALSIPDLDQRQKALVGSLQAGGLALIVDKTWQSVCDDTRFTLRSNHSFVVYATTAEDPDNETHEVFDGAWVVRNQSGNVGEIQLFGRRHRTETSWVPYGSAEVASSVRIAGGKSKLWLHDISFNAESIEALNEPAFRSAHAWCQPEGVAWADASEDPLLFVTGSSLAGIFRLSD